MTQPIQSLAHFLWQKRRMLEKQQTKVFSMRSGTRVGGHVSTCPPSKRPRYHENMSPTHTHTHGRVNGGKSGRFCARLSTLTVPPPSSHPRTPLLLSLVQSKHFISCQRSLSKALYSLHKCNTINRKSINPFFFFKSVLIKVGGGLASTAADPWYIRDWSPVNGGPYVDEHSKSRSHRWTI